MQEERNAFRWTTDYGRRNPGSAAGGVPNEEQLNVYAEDLTQLNRQVLERARSILTPEQLVALERFQLNQTQMQVNLMKLAGKMFAPPAN